MADPIEEPNQEI